MEFTRDGSPVGSVVLMKRRLRIIPADVLMVLFGPKILEASPEKWSFVLGELAHEARTRRALYVAVQPYVLENGDFVRRMSESGYERKQGHILFHHSVWVDLSPSEEDIFASFDGNIRKAVRKAEREGIEVCVNEGPDCVDQFYDLYQAAHHRSGGGYQPRVYFEHVWNTLAGKREALFCLAKLRGRPIAALLLGFVDGNMVYLSGGAVGDEAQMNARPNERMHWEMIRLAKRWGCRFYDLGGITPDAPEGSKSFGIAAFKRKFSSDVRAFAGYYRFDVKPVICKVGDLVLPLAGKLARRYRGARETDYNLL
jgi:lipid II:glycine glycyltransferase (peptidoglycan interpeptide bridge formation enzyme)